MFTGQVLIITQKIRENIQDYVKEKFSSSLEDFTMHYDLLQDEETIKSVFDKDNRMLYYLFHQDRIGKLVFNSEAGKSFNKEHLVCQMFDFSNQVPSLTVSTFSIFHEISFLFHVKFYFVILVLILI